MVDVDARHECQRCSSDEWLWCDYRGCSACFEPEASRLLPERDAGAGLALSNSLVELYRDKFYKAEAELVARDAELAEARADLKTAARSDEHWFLRFRALEAEVARLHAEREAERRREPSDEGGPGHEVQYWMRAKCNAAIRHLRDMEDYFRLLGGLPEGFNALRADRARQLHEAISDDLLNGKRGVQTVRERAETAERLAHDRGEALAAASKYLAELHHRGIVNEPLRCHVDGLLAGVVPPEQATREEKGGRRER